MCATILLQLSVIEGGRGILHECQRGVCGVAEGTIVTVGKGMGIVEPGWHTHVDLALQQPIWTQLKALASAGIGKST